jgi:hypothetical protein
MIANPTAAASERTSDRRVSPDESDFARRSKRLSSISMFLLEYQSTPYGGTAHAARILPRFPSPDQNVTLSNSSHVMMKSESGFGVCRTT